MGRHLTGKAGEKHDRRHRGQKQFLLYDLTRRDKTLRVFCRGASESRNAGKKTPRQKRKCAESTEDKNRNELKGEEKRLRAYAN